MPAETSTVSTGIAGLDAVLAGGLPCNRLYVVEGESGTGKTTIGLQFLLRGIRAGEKGLFLALSETEEELHAVAATHGWSLDGMALREVSTRELAPEENNTLFHPAEVELGETTKCLFQEVERVSPARVVIDSLSEFRLLSQSGLRYRRQILALKQFFVGKKCTVLLLNDAPREVSDAHLYSIVHGIVQLEQLAPLYGAERRRIRVVKLRGVKFHGGYHDMKIETGGVVVYPRLVAAENPKAFSGEQISSGIPELDRLTGGGLERGTTTLILGPAGTGKSAIASQYATASAHRGERVAIFTFDEGTETLLARSQGLGIPLARQLEAGLIQVKHVDPAEMSPGEFVHFVRESVQEQKVRVVFIDSLNGYIHAMPEEHALSNQLQELFTYLRQRGVVVILTMAQHGLLGPLESPLDVSYLADSVLLLRHFEAQCSIRKAISVLKKRSIHETALRELSMDGKGLHVGEPLEQFRGILTGVPIYEGTGKNLRRKRDESIP
jgi:circadian clock protein KaiC